MKKDILFPKVEGVSVCVIQENSVDFPDQKVWNVYLINETRTILENVMVSSTGYIEQLNGEKKSSSTLRHYFKTVKARSYVKIEPIIEQVFQLNNEYWVSFYKNNSLFDKKFIFLPESIDEKYFTDIAIINQKGIWIK
jgi:hypothetical protein